MRAKSRDRAFAQGFGRLRIWAACACLLCVFCCAEPVRAAGESAETRPEPGGLERLYDDARITGGLYFFGRDRRRYDTERKTYKTNLRHGSLQANLDLVSGYAWEHLGVDFGVFTSHDLFNYGAPDHEMGFMPWQDPWHPDWDKHFTLTDVSVYKAALKAKAGPAMAQSGLAPARRAGVLA